MKKKVIFPTMLALAILTIGILATNVSAQNSQYPPVVQKIAQKFNLDVSEVQKVFDEDRDARRAEMYASFSDRLDELVLAGKITSSQKEVILEKHEQMRDKMEALRDLSPDERREKKLSIHTDYKNWLSSQGLSAELVQHLGYRNGFRAGYKMWADQ